MAQEDSQDDSHFGTSSGVKPMARNVATPDISRDMKQDRSKLKAMCSSLRG